MARRINLRDDDDSIEYTFRKQRDFEAVERSSNWLPLLIVPLLLGGLLWGLQSYTQNTMDREDPNSQQFGVGGGPVVSQPVSPIITAPSPTMTMTPTPSMMEEDMEVSPTGMGMDDL